MKMPREVMQRAIDECIWDAVEMKVQAQSSEILDTELTSLDAAGYVIVTKEEHERLKLALEGVVRAVDGWHFDNWLCFQNARAAAQKGQDDG